MKQVWTLSLLLFSVLCYADTNIKFDFASMVPKHSCDPSVPCFPYNCPITGTFTRDTPHGPLVAKLLDDGTFETTIVGLYHVSGHYKFELPNRIVAFDLESDLQAYLCDAVTYQLISQEDCNTAVIDVAPESPCVPPPGLFPGTVERVKEGNWFQKRLFTGPVSLNPFNSFDAFSFEVQGPIFDVLMVIDPITTPLVLIPRLALSYELNGQNLVIHLRPGVTWHDGMPFTAEDVAFSIQRYVANGFLTFSATASVVSPLTVHVTLSKPRATAALEILPYPMVPKHIFASLSSVEQENLWLLPLNTTLPRVIGTGPFKLWYHTDRTTKLIKNENYYLNKAFLDGIEYGYGDDGYSGLDATAYDAFDPRSQDTGGFKTLEQTQALFPDYNCPIYNSFSSSVIHFNLRDTNKPTAKKLVRQAIVYSLDFSTISLNGEIATSPLPSYLFAYRPAQPVYSFNVQRTRDLLTQAGYVFNPTTGFFDGCDVNAIVLSSDIRALLLVDQMRAAGINVTKILTTFGEALTRLETGDFDLLFLGWGYGLQDPSVIQALYTGTGSYGGYVNPMLDTLFDQGAETLDTEIRKQIYGQIQDILWDDMPIYAFYFSKSVICLRKDIFGYTLNPQASLVLSQDFNSIWIRK